MKAIHRLHANFDLDTGKFMEMPSDQEPSVEEADGSHRPSDLSNG